MNEVELGRAIQAARKKTGLTQQELCQKTGISYSTLAKIERGAIKSPSVFTVVNIAGVCGLTVEELAGGSRISGTKSPSKETKRAKNGIQFVYFDVNGCMVRFFQAAFSSIASDTGTSPEAVEATFWHYNDDVCGGKMSLQDFNKILAERLGVESVDWAKYYLEAVQPIPETQGVLLWASQQSFKVGLLTNIMPGLIDALMQKGALPKINYDAIVDSSKVKAIKPDAHIFELAAEAAGVAPGDILLVDDSRANLMAAGNMGWHTLWFDDFRPTESVDKIKELLEI